MRKLIGRKRRHKILRKKISGNNERPRLCITRSNKNLSGQLIDDTVSRTLFSLSTNAPDFRSKLSYGGNVKAAVLFGEEFARRAKAKGFGKVAFDRAGYRYHGRLKAFAEAARKNGLVF
ncbi:MAG: 50S ribosomal protein L18 [Omnitrophica bacterium]|nr:50S ribosomal protein L18 [Candidatus Omnitrophota bacterium]